MEIGDNTNKEPEKDLSTTGIYWCAVCDYPLDINHICWNTDFEGTGENCPMYGLPQA